MRPGIATTLLIAAFACLALPAPARAGDGDIAVTQVDDPGAATAVESAPADPAAKSGAVTPNDKFDARRKRISFQTRLSGGIDLYRASYGGGGLIQIGLGIFRWLDVRVGVGFPGYFVTLDFELNMYPFGRFVPTLALRNSFDPVTSQATRAWEMNLGCEFWILDWLAAYVQVGVGATCSISDNFEPHLYIPAWVGVEMRY